jgi:predicted phage terminase large subunit-like protein
LKATVAENPFQRQVPTAKQALFLTCEAREALFGGAAGGGKSSALLMAALQYVGTPNYAALLLRRRLTDLTLPGALMDRAYAWLKSKADWREKDKSWHFPSGATLTFGYLDNDGDQFRYQSSEFQFIGFDELTQFDLTQYTYLFSRLRKLKDSPVPLRMRAASNPGDKGHAWVKERFGIAERIDQPIWQPESDRLFIPSRLDDNEHIDRDEYRESLSRLDPFTRAQLQAGDWSEYSGGFFRREWFPITDHPPDDIEHKVRAWDTAATEPRPGKDPDYTCGVLLGRTKAKEFIVLDAVRIRGTALEVERLVRRTAEHDGRGVPIYMEEVGASGKQVTSHYARNILAGWAFYPAPTSNLSKKERAAPLSSMAEAGHVRLLRGHWNGAYLDELAGFPQGDHDDQVDASSLALLQSTAKRKFWMAANGVIARAEEAGRAEDAAAAMGWDGKPIAFPTVEEGLAWAERYEQLRVKHKDGTETVEAFKEGEHIDLRPDAEAWQTISGSRGWSSLGPGLPGGFRQRFGR